MSVYLEELTTDWWVRSKVSARMCISMRIYQIGACGIKPRMRFDFKELESVRQGLTYHVVAERCPPP